MRRPAIQAETTTTALAPSPRGWKASTFDPEGELPANYFAVRGAFLTGERRLLHAVLERALIDVTQHAGATGRHRRNVVAKARAWFESRDRVWLYSFERVAEALEVDAEYIRRLIANHAAAIRATLERRRWAALGAEARSGFWPNFRGVAVAA